MPSYPDLQLYIDGTWRGGEEAIPVLNPADESVVGTLPMASSADLDDALTAAVDGHKVWSKTAPAKRAEIILRAVKLLRERADDIAYSITLENGKPIAQARQEVQRACEFFEWDAAEGLRTYGRIVPSAPDIRYTVLHRPIGPVAAFSPWNFPTSQPSRKIAGSLAAGCSIILKAAEETPAGAVHIVRALHDAGLPAGVLNLVFGVPSDISRHLIPKSPIRLVAFTGSTAVGKHLTELAARNMKPALMELGGHAPVIVCEDVDPIEAAELSVIRKARNSGQVCTSPTRFFVHEAVYAQFVHAFAQRAEAITMGNGLASKTRMGPVANLRRKQALEALVCDARAKGAKIVAGGDFSHGPGYFFPLTVLTEISDDARAMKEEPFGPLALINPVVSLEEAIAKANSLPFGLAAYAFTHSASNVHQLSERVEAGNLSINTLEASVAETPFGGVKESGYGREGGIEGLSHYMTVKNISHRISLG